MVICGRITSLLDSTDITCVLLEYLALWHPICKTDPYILPWYKQWLIIVIMVYVLSIKKGETLFDDRLKNSFHLLSLPTFRGSSLYNILNICLRHQSEYLSPKPSKLLTASHHIEGFWDGRLTRDLSCWKDKSALKSTARMDTRFNCVCDCIQSSLLC